MVVLEILKLGQWCCNLMLLIEKGHSTCWNLTSFSNINMNDGFINLQGLHSHGEPTQLNLKALKVYFLSNNVLHEHSLFCQSFEYFKWKICVFFYYWSFHGELRWAGVSWINMICLCTDQGVVAYVTRQLSIKSNHAHTVRMKRFSFWVLHNYGCFSFF